MSDPTTDPIDHDTGSPSIDVALRSGIALFNEGYPLAAHEPWEAAWLPLDRGGDERLLHGLIQVAAATHHARTGNRSGAIGCAEGALDYLDGLGPEYRGLALDPIRSWCRRIATDPTSVGRSDTPSFRVDGVVVGFDDLDLDATLATAPALAEAIDVADEAPLESAVALAREERGTGRTRFAELLIAFLRNADARPQIVARIGDHVDRAERKRRDVDDLF
ncbi:DUF309 domain-containing protein [Halorubrum sp. DTA98]|uniref:DUF309 domain-containing protein n=1 Tax=Halorubrum sp. DTA98 TaxID=3402163 RepID=UPI003AAC58FB